MMDTVDMRLSLRTSERIMMVDITKRVEELLSEQGIVDGLCHVHCPHTTAGLTINEGADPDVSRDLLVALNGIAPATAVYLHAEGNSDAHIKSSLIGVNTVLAIRDGRLSLGRWQALFFCEFDGPRTRQVWIRIIS